MSRHLQDLEFHVTAADGDTIAVYNAHGSSATEAFDRAKKHAERVNAALIDVCCWSKGAAKLWNGEYGAEEYDADPDASVHDRLIFDDGEWKSHGRVA